MQEFNKRALRLDGSMDLFSDIDDSFCDESSAVTCSESSSTNSLDRQFKRARSIVTVGGSTSLFAQITQPISFFAAAEVAHANAQQQAHAQPNVTTNINVTTPTVTASVTTLKRNQATFFEQTEFSLPTSKRTLDVPMPLALNPNLLFRDGSVPVSYKEGNPVILKIMKKREEVLNPVEGGVIDEHKCLPKNTSYTGLKLVSLPDNKWMIHDGLTNTYMNPEAGVAYAFVTMPDKTIRIMPSIQRAHLLSSNMSPVICYAGNVIFNAQNQISSWDNISGAYKPSADLAHQAGFHLNDMGKFKKYVASTENIERVSNITGISMPALGLAR